LNIDDDASKLLRTPMVTRQVVLTNRTKDLYFLLKDPDENVRIAVSDYLFKNVRNRNPSGESVVPLFNPCPPHPFVYESLYKALYDDHWKVRWNAALVFRNMMQLMREETDPYVARIANKIRQFHRQDKEHLIQNIEALSRIAGPAFYYAKSFTYILVHADWEVRLAGIKAIENEPQNRKFFLKSKINHLTRDERPEIREVAMRIIWKSGALEGGPPHFTGMDRHHQRIGPQTEFKDKCRNNPYMRKGKELKRKFAYMPTKWYDKKLRNQYGGMRFTKPLAIH